MRTLLTTACLLALAGAGLPAAAAAEPDAIIIPHDLHHEMDVDCLTCHEGVDASTRAAESFRPGMDVCADCHDVEDEDNCTMCHVNPDEAGDYPALAYGASAFAHAPHVARDLACAACHGDPAAAQPVLPGKPDCRVCHATADAYADCRLCHGPDDDLHPADHDAFWREHHGLRARDDRDACALCHTETTCQECHAGDNVRPRSHPLNYAFNHALDARASSLECAVCHEDPDFCSSCHAAHRVMPRNHSQSDWLGGPDGGRHAVEGVFDMESCAACHSEGADAPTCAACHGG